MFFSFFLVDVESAVEHIFVAKECKLADPATLYCLVIEVRDLEKSKIIAQLLKDRIYASKLQELNIFL